MDWVRYYGWVWDWLISWGWVRDWLISWSWVRGFAINGFTRIFDVSNISVVSIRISGVCNSLKTTVRKSYGVGSRCYFGIRSFSSVELRARVIISYSIFICVWFGGHWYRLQASARSQKPGSKHRWLPEIEQRHMGGSQAVL